MKRLILTGLIAVSSLCIAQAPPSGIMAPVVTRAYNNARTGMNPNETILTVAKVKSAGIVKYFSLPLEGDARGTEAQPLIVPKVKMDDGVTRDIVIVTSMNNLVYCFDANTSDILWVKKLGIPIAGANPANNIDMYKINDHWGSLSTGVIDTDTNTWYGVAWTSPNGLAANGTYSLYSLNIVNGQVAYPTLSLSNVTYQPTNGGARQSYSSIMRKQRSSLLLTNVNGTKTILFASGTMSETSTGSAGWIIAYDIASHSISTALTMTAGDGAGIWMGGQGLAADSKGYIYGETGNGNFNGIDNFGEVAFKVQYLPPTILSDAIAVPAVLKIIDWWSPWSDAGRVGRSVITASVQRLPKKMSGMSLPTAGMESAMPINGMKPRDFSKAHYVGNLLYPDAATDNGAWSDEDLGSAQGALIEPYGVFLVGGKDGISYPVNMNNMGQTMPADFANAKANCAKLISPPIWATTDPGPVDPCPQDPTTLNFLPWGKTRHQHSTPVQYQSSVHGRMIFFWGENSQLHAWSIANNGALTYLAQGNEIASANITNSPGGMPGGFMTMSSNSNQAGTAILWATIPYGNANTSITNGRLLAYDPDNFITNADGSKTLAVLWDSAQWGINFVFNKFNPPIVSGGKIFVPTYDDQILVFGLN